MEQNFDTTEQEDVIAVDSKAGLEVFAEHVDQLREEVETLQAEYHTRYENIPPEFYAAGEAYQRLRTLVIEALGQLFTSDQVSDDLVDELQATYNSLSEARDGMALLTAVGEEVSEVIDEVIEEVTLPHPDAGITTAPSSGEGIASPFYTPAEVAQSQIPERKQPAARNFASHAKKADALFKKKEPAPRPLELLTPEILANSKYQKVIEHYFGSPALFEATLLREIEKREQPSKLDAFLGVVHQSAFHTFLKDLPLSEIAMLEGESFTVIRERVSALHIDYGIYVEWMKDVPVMQHVVRPHAAMTFSELYVRAELEILWQQFSNG